MKSDFDRLKTCTSVLCFSSGQTSALMTKKTLEELECRPAFRNGTPCHISKFNTYVFVIFNNTSQETEESLKFAHNCDVYYKFRTVWLEAFISPKKGVGPVAKIVSFETACRNGDVFEAFIQKHGLPQPGKRKCTQILKTDNTNNFLKQQGLRKNQVYQLVGIRIDEPHRHKWETAKKNRVIWPLTTIWPTTKFEVINFFNLQPFRLMLESYAGNCITCHLKTDRKLMTIALERPKDIEWTIRMDDKYENYVPENHTIKPPIKRYRDYKSMRDIVEDAHTTDFELAIDESDLKAIYKDGLNIDQNEECGESCDAFN